MKSLVQPECGGSNALVNLSQQFGTSTSRSPMPNNGNLVRSMMPNATLGQAFANEYLSGIAKATPSPATFNMAALVSQLPRNPHQMARSPHPHQMAQKWSGEFLPQATISRNWSAEYLQSPAVQMETAWNDAVVPSVGQMVSRGPQSTMWSSEYLANYDQQTMENSWKTEQMANQWANEFADRSSQGAYAADTAGGFWQNLESEWDSLARTDPTFQWNPPAVEEYQMQGENPFIEEENLLTRGEQSLNSGNLTNAILQLEAAVQKNPEDAKAWCLLGLCQAENEQDTRAIVAFRRSLNIDPLNLEAILGLAVSYANESMENDALMQLERWLDANAEYSNPQANVSPRPPTSSFLDQSRFAQVERCFLEAANRQRADGVDAGLQNALGILYNLNRNYDRAVDSIKAALAVKPEDARLWNRLGATLANGERTAEAVAAYRRALQLHPAYVRARYNLGISCMHLDSHREALQHFISALQLQNADGHGDASKNSTGGIWQTVRSAILRFAPGDPQLLAATERRDITALQQALGL